MEFALRKHSTQINFLLNPDEDLRKRIYVARQGPRTTRHIAHSISQCCLSHAALEELDSERLDYTASAMAEGESAGRNLCHVAVLYRTFGSGCQVRPPFVSGGSSDNE